MIEYILNQKAKKVSVLHIRIDGLSHESCNLDQIRDSLMTTEIPVGRKWTWCSRCRVSAGGAP